MTGGSGPLSSPRLMLAGGVAALDGDAGNVGSGCWRTAQEARHSVVAIIAAVLSHL
jgi:hypothetical protein